ncbi:flagellar basal body rod protein FlgC [Microbulbifer rhizosphaerae]|uniref:Flagellar basal-body rod protein FlgC n=1 Tax=Microbulbifer rhizosphaerae TaxID=1562603 RepID=A0A7W4WFW3_9GAMM|nr:flagellar basal body rod protein FlgC [Microbulbifer rhizosphaerae]MBB3063489.1 flagellar basal-body rod protein FlgC [Microbulbifer rhizosphaerae]
MSNDVFSISLTGLEFQRLKADAVAMNIANSSNSARSVSEVYKPLEALATVSGTNNSKPVMDVRLVERSVEPNKVYDPSHPYADGNGFVFRPGVDPVQEMVNLMTATRMYQANVQVLEASKQMIQWAIETGVK